MAVLAAAALLDELMGRNRNVAPNTKTKELNWEDPEYCKMYLVKFCPHDLFVNTRADLGQCPKVHDDEAKSLYEKSKSHRKLQYEEEFMRFCQSMLNEVERKITKGKQRLALMGKTDVVTLSPAQTQKNEEQISFLTEKINSLVSEAEQMGIQGNVEQAQGLMKLCDQLKEEREQLRGSNENSHWQQTADLAASQEKQMEVCDVCGAFLIVGDAQQRIDDHLMGKQHVGYARLRSAVEEMTEERERLREERERKREDERRERLKSREEERRRDRHRERDRDDRRNRRRNDSRGRARRHSRSPHAHHSTGHRRDRDRDRDRNYERDHSRKEREYEHKISRSHHSGSRSDHGYRDNKSSDSRRDSYRKSDDSRRKSNTSKSEDSGKRGDEIYKKNDEYYDKKMDDYEKKHEEFDSPKKYEGINGEEDISAESSSSILNQMNEDSVASKPEEANWEAYQSVGDTD